MTALALSDRPAPSLFSAEPRFAAAGWLFALSLAATVAASLVDPRLFQGEGVWVKPMKFQIALTIYLLSLAFFAQWLPAGLTARPWWRIYAWFVVACTIAEMLWIGGAAMAGTSSHFNHETVTMSRLYAAMGVIAVSLTTATLVMGIAIWRNPASGLPPALHLAVALGLVLTFMLTVPVAGTMAQHVSHLVGVPPTGAEVPLFGWSREVGDLRIAHFLATHAMHALPIAGLLAIWLLPVRWARPAVWVAAGVFTALVAAIFAGALAGRPLLPLG